MGLTVSVIRKPLCGTVAHNVMEHGTGGINVDKCRIGTTGGSQHPSGFDRYNASLAEAGYRPGLYQKGTPPAPTLKGRWPANVVLCDLSEITQYFPESTSGSLSASVQAASFGAHGIYGKSRGHKDGTSYESNSGSTSRFFHQVSE